jgi:hypothetical protein
MIPKTKNVSAVPKSKKENNRHLSRKNAMPRCPAIITLSEILRIIRAANKVGAAEIIINREGEIRIVLASNAASASLSTNGNDQVWTPSVPVKKKRWSSRDATSWRDIPKGRLRY